ncbi:hypothetical protein BDV41DRAFT_581521 [Aspergillus transmontanensis]|uniref:Uncharacterized protein n=1 Tax=Aspergillus transmontanensis TaxID=1034304 RepID=A0A5N6VMM9_9EURO|nr:hypothetical protein BDV41DRAFT_581521 [Aspergillus transmontanensis]
MSCEPNDSAGIQASSAKVEAEAENKTQDHGEEMNQDVAESTIIRHPSVVSLTSLDNLDIMFVNSTSLERKSEKEAHDSVSFKDHKVVFLNVAGRGILRRIHHHRKSDRARS